VHRVADDVVFLAADQVTQLENRLPVVVRSPHLEVFIDGDINQRVDALGVRRDHIVTRIPWINLYGPDRVENLLRCRLRCRDSLAQTSLDQPVQGVVRYSEALDPPALIDEGDLLATTIAERARGVDQI